MLATTSSRELAEWEAYARLEPFGELRRDGMIGQLTAVLANVFRGPQADAYTPAHFVHIPASEDEAAYVKPAPWKAMLAKLKAYTKVKAQEFLGDR